MNSVCYAGNEGSIVVNGGRPEDEPFESVGRAAERIRHIRFQERIQNVFTAVAEERAE